MHPATDHGRAKAAECAEIIGAPARLPRSMAGHQVMVFESTDNNAACVAVIGEAVTVDIWLDRTNLAGFLRDLKAAAAACGVPS
jgi:hypothetical protein